MRAYVALTGALFALLTIVHLWRVIDIEPHLARESWFVLITLVSAALSVWAIVLLRRRSR